MTKHETKMLAILSTINECVIMPFRNEDEDIISYTVTLGIPAKYMAKKDHPDELEVVKEYTTDNDKLLFLRQFGMYMKDSELRQYGYSHYVLCKELRYRYTKTEQHLLERLDAGEFDCPLIYYFESDYGNTFTWSIENGIPIEYKTSRSARVFNGRENETIDKKPNIYRKCLTDDSKLEFFQRYGRDMHDDEAIDYCWANRYKLYREK